MDSKRTQRMLAALIIANLGLVVLVAALAWGGGVARALGRRAPAAAQGEQTIPSIVNYQGYVEDDKGNPINGDRDVVFRICDAVSGGSCPWSESHPAVPFDKGRFAAALGSQGNPITGSLFVEPTRWLEIEIATEVLTPRLQLAAVPYAFNAARLDGKTESELLSGVGISGSLPSGAVVWFREGSSPVGYTRMTGTLGLDLGAWESLPNVPTEMGSPGCLIWTGDEMLCWNNWELEGARYNTAVNAWTAITTTGAPVSRSVQSAAWTGSEMIIWGGDSDSGCLNTGGRYNPGSDSWTPMATAGAPISRSGHSLVWTGSEVFVWGGRDNSGPGCYDTGGRYDPVGDSWLPITTTNAPGSRTGHAVIWTGSEMIVWGGNDCDGAPVYTGGRYDPSTDTWTPMDTPAPYYMSDCWGKEVAWTGTEMVAVPPDSNYAYLRFYNPAGGTWRMTPRRNPRAFPPHRCTDLLPPLVNGDRLLTLDGVYDLSLDEWLALATETVYGRYALWADDEVIVVDAFGNVLRHTIDLIYPYVRD